MQVVNIISGVRLRDQLEIGLLMGSAKKEYKYKEKPKQNKQKTHPQNPHKQKRNTNEKWRKVN